MNEKMLYNYFANVKQRGIYIMKLNEAIAKRLNELLSEKSMTAYALFMKSGVSQSTISDLKNMNNTGVNLRILYELCEGFEIGINEFFDSPLFTRENIVD